jgi:hypothetical protein
MIWPGHSRPAKTREINLLPLDNNPLNLQQSPLSVVMTSSLWQRYSPPRTNYSMPGHIHILGKIVKSVADESRLACESAQRRDTPVCRNLTPGNATNGLPDYFISRKAMNELRFGAALPHRGHCSRVHALQYNGLGKLGQFLSRGLFHIVMQTVTV